MSHAILRRQPEDFQVTERMPIAPSGNGEHLWLRVRKRGFNTDDVARQLARLAGIARRDVGYAGMKDRRAVAEQWFSLHLPGRPEPEWTGLPPGVEILESVRHHRKLKTGALTGNCFTIVLRECHGDPNVVRARVETIRRDGVPNYFGEQRFGRDGSNVERARGMFSGAERPRDRHQQGIYLSAARSWIFNTVLAERVRAGTWNAILPGEACMLAGRNSFFVSEQPDETLHRRLADHDIHPSGPLWGEGELPCLGVVRELEQRVAARLDDLAAGLAAAGLRQERRALRVVPEEIKTELLDADTWRLSFCLPAGSYATAVVRELAEYAIASGEPIE